MWTPLAFLLLVGFISALTTPAWRDNKEYVYSIQGRTLTSLDIANEFSGILMKATLRIQTRPDGKLQGLLVNPQYAQIHSELSEGAMTYIPDAEVNWKSLEMTRDPFQIVLNRGVITDLIVTRSMPNWEANILKGIISQLQLNINHWETYTTEKGDRHDSASFIIPEETVSGHTDTFYEINPLPEHLLLNSAIVPDFQNIEENESDIFEVVKHKNYTASVELPSFTYGLGNVFGTKAATNVMGEFFIRNTMTRALITGSTKQFTIHNSFTLNEVSLNPTFTDNQQGSVISMWNATLEKLKSQDKLLEDILEPVHLGGLVYSYGNPYSQSNRVQEKQKDHDYLQYDRPTWQRNSKQISYYFDSQTKSSQSYKQEKPELSQPARSPLLPYTVGNRGLSIKHDIDIVKSVTSIAVEIGNDLQDPRKTLTENTLAKFSNLIKLVRTMDESELKRAGNELFCANNQDHSKYTAWATYRDAVAESGSSPSLLVIINWIESRNLKLMEAANVMAQMVDSVQTPTTEYIKTLFEFIKKPIVTTQWPLNETAVLSFSELTRQVYFQNNFYKTNFPRKSFKDLRENEGRKFVRESIIPYFKKCLNQAVINDDPSKIHTYIRVLGLIGDIEVLKAFEPYLEGKKQCSQYQRTLMVLCMDKLVKTYPEAAQTVLFRIYENSGEYQPLRVAAVYQLMRTKPSVAMLQLMASYTKVDLQEEINAAVKTSIQSAASLESDEFMDLRYAAKMALPLLTDKEYGIQKGGNYLRNYFVNQLNLQYKETIQLYGSSDSFIPSGIKYALRSNEGGRRSQILNVQALLTSVDQLLEVFYEKTESFYQDNKEKLKQQQNNQWSSQNIARLLNMKADAREQLEGSVFLLDTVLPIKMLSINNDTIEQLPQLLKDFEKYLNEDKDINEIKLYNGDDAIIAIPLEMGVPFVFTYDAPMVLKVNGKVKAAVTNNLSHNGRIQKPDIIKIRSDVTVTFGSKIQGHISFFTPFDRRQYYSGFEKSMQIYLPVAGTFELNLNKNELVFDMEPKETYKEAPLFHYSTWPFTSWRDIADLRTLVAQHHNQYIRQDNMRTFDAIVGKQQTGLAYHIKIEHNRNNIQKPDLDMFWQKGNLDALKNLWSNADIQYSQINITHLPQQSSTKNVQIRLRYQQDYNEKRDDYSFTWSKVSAAKKSSERSEMLLKGVSADVSNVESQAVDLSLRFKGEKSIEYIVSGAVSNSNVDPTSRILIFYKKDQESTVPYEATLEVVNYVPNTNTLNLDYVLTSQLKTQSAVTLMFDTANREKGMVKADVKLTRSDKRKEYLKKLPMYQQCKRDMRINNNQSPACVNMTLIAPLLDKITVNLKYNNLSPMIEDAFETSFDYLRYVYYPSVQTDYEQSQLENEIKLESQFDEDLKFVNISVSTNRQKNTFMDIEVGEYSRKIFVVHPSLPLTSRLMSKVLEIDTIYPVCVADQTQVTAFSNWTYPASLSNHWTVLAQYVPRLANEEQQIYSVNKQLKQQQTNLVVLIRRSVTPLKSQKAKEVKIVISSPETDFEPIEVSLSPNQKGILGVLINGQQIEVTESVSHDIKNGYIQVYALPNDEIRVEIKNILYLTYDGLRIKLEATSSLLRGATRGLCGIWTDQQNEEYLTPLNCYAKNPEKFVKSYEIEGKDGEKTRQELVQNSHQCIEKNMPMYINIVRLGDLISSVNMEYSEGNNCMRHHTRYSEQKSQICFTTTDVPSCNSQCQAQGYITKSVPVHCISKSNAALLWKKQIDAGANIDFSHKPEHKKYKWKFLKLVLSKVIDNI